MSKYWKNESDIWNDMAELSPFCNIPNPAPQPSELMKKLRGKPSMFEDDLPPEEPQQEAKCLPVRGHPLFTEAIRKPGGKPSFTEQRTIREVSGLGYGNGLLEHAFKGVNSDDEKDPKRMKNLSFESPSRKSAKKSGDESDNSTSSAWDRGSYSSKSHRTWSGNIPDINNKKEFPDLK